MSLPPVSRVHSHPCSICNVQRSFCPLPEDLRDIFEGLKTSAVYGKGEMAFQESDSCHSVFAVCQGSMKLVTSSGGKVLLLRFAGPGELLGVAEAVLEGAPYECSAIAAEPSVLAIIPRETFVKFVTAHPETRVRLNIVLSEQYKIAQRETRFLALGETSTARLARLLLTWSTERGVTAGDGIHLPLHVTQSELAQLIGSARETVTRILGDLSHRGVIERTPEGIIIHSTEELTRLATQ